MTDPTAPYNSGTHTHEGEWQGPLFESAPIGAHYTFRSFGSGSCGNCSILGYGDTSILIDLGIGARLFAKSLKEHHIDPTRLQGILITHDHADHIRGVAPFASRYGVPIYTTEEIAYGMLNSKYIRQDLSGFLRRVKPGESFSIGDMRIESFPVPHDATNNAGYSITTEAGVFTIITDIGHITEEIEQAVVRSNYLVFESNYDEEMLRTGRYPLHLRQRISGGHGHLSNRLSAETIARLYGKQLRFLALCHLSGDNNTPELALRTMSDALSARGIDTARELRLEVLRRGEISPRYLLF